VSGSVEVIRAGYDAYARGDVEGMLACLAPDVELTSAFGDVEGRSYHGHEGIRAWLADVDDAWEEFALEVTDITEVGGERVVVELDVTARGRSGVEVHTKLGALWSVREGLGARGVIHRSPADAWRAAREELLREGFEAMNRGDYEAAVADMPPEVEWHDPPELIGSGVHRGPAEVRRFWEGFGEAWDEWRMELLDLTPLSDEQFLVHVRMLHRGQESGIELDYAIWQVWSYHGAQLARVEGYVSRADALAAAGG
jgi:ketosteroid isomerase-like protein